MAEEFRRSGKYGRKETATILKAARIRAGFRSAAVAATNFGWSPDTLRGHESGTRGIHEDDAKKYAAAFGLEVHQLLKPSHLWRKTAYNLDDLKKKEAKKAKDQKELVSSRLRFARIVRGFPTLTSAASYLGAKSRGTVNNHETGANGISERVAEAYGLAYGIEIGWLLHGTLPSGLGDEVDRLLSKKQWALDLGALAKILPTIQMSNPPDGERIQMLFSSATSKSRPTRDRTASALDEKMASLSPSSAERLFEVDVTDIERLRQGRTEPSSKDWELPPGFLSNLIGSSASDVIILAVPRDHPLRKLGDRLFVDRSRRDVSSGGLFVYLLDGRELAVLKYFRGEPARFHDPETLIGKIVASFASLDDDPPDLTEDRRRLLSLWPD